MKINFNPNNKEAALAAIEQAFDFGVIMRLGQLPGKNPQTGQAKGMFIEVDDDPNNPAIAIRSAVEEAATAKKEAEEAQIQLSEVQAAALAVFKSAGLDEESIQRNYDDVLTIVPESRSAADGVEAPMDETVVKNLDTVYLAQEDVIADTRVYKAVGRA